MKTILFASLLALCLAIHATAQANKPDNEYIPKQYASVNDALTALKDCGAAVPKGLCDEDAVYFLEDAYLKGNKKVLSKIMGINRNIDGHLAEDMGWFLGDVLEKDTTFFVESMLDLPADLQMHVAYNAAYLDGSGMAVSRAKSVLEKLYPMQKNNKIGSPASICIMALENMLADEEKFNLQWECEKRPPLAPAGGKIWGMDCATNKLFIGDYYTNQEVTILLSEQTVIIGFKGGMLSCTDMKPGDRVHVWPKTKTDGTLDKAKPVEASVVVVEK